MTPFVVVTFSRSGSHHVMYLLNLHPQIKARGEIINATFETTSDEKLIQTGFWVSKTRRAAGVKAVGFKLLQDGQLAGRPLTIPRLLEVPNIHVIILERLNQLERLRSKTQAVIVDRWAVDTPPPVELPVVTLERFDTLYWLQHARAFHNQMRTIPNHLLWLHYEDLLSDQNKAMKPVWGFLGVNDPGRLPPVSYRQETRPLSETVTNLDEITRFLAGTPHQVGSSGVL